MPAVEIRDERPGDEAAIRRITAAAFADAPHAGGDEAEIVDRLRAGGALALSLVAVAGGEPVGHVAISPAALAGVQSGWYTLGPLSVLPRQQRRGIGSALIDCAMARLRAAGAAGCILVGDPGYYRRFGFDPAPRNAPDDEYAEYFMLLRFGTAAATGRFAFHPAFFGNDV